MKKIFKKITGAIARLFNKIIDEEAKRVDEFHCRIFGDKSNEGGEN